MRGETRNPNRAEVLLPGPTAGSGGMRTAVQAGEALAAKGYRVTLHVETGNAGARRQRKMADQTRDWFGVRRSRVSIGWPRELSDADIVIATTWQSGATVAGIRTPGVKAHFVQDYECWFHQHGDHYLAAASVYDRHLASIVIGDWLPQILWERHRLAVRSVPFTADPAHYHGGDPGHVGARTIVAMYQPDKARRCGRLMADTLAQVLRDDHTARVVTVGSAADPRLGDRHQHLGVLSPRELGDLYRSGGVGLSMSASNPSRVPFEMLACGLPVVELGLSNNGFDFPAESCLLAHPDPVSVSSALRRVLDDPGRRSAMAEYGVTFMADRPASREGEEFVAAVDAILNGEPAREPQRAARQSEEPITVRGAPVWDGGPGPTRMERLRRRIRGG